MNYLSVDALTKTFGERTLFESISFGVAKGEKVALIANNGTGKSTLLRILTGKDIADSGTIAFREGIRVHFLEQEPVIEGEGSIAGYLATANQEVRELISTYESLSKKAEDQDPEHLKALEAIQSQMEVRNAWDYEQRLKKTLSILGIDDLSLRLNALSGGQKKRLAMSLVLVDEPDLLILDEPTNHLDLEMVEWLESYLTQSSVSLLIVTHDRYFLDRVCNVILEMHRNQLYKHHGNYAYFLEKRSEREEVRKVDLDKLKRLLKKELEWMRRQPKARTTKSKARIDAFHELKEKTRDDQPSSELKLDVKMSRIGGKVLEMKKVYKRYGDKVILNGFDYTFKKGERIGIIGSNGAGKSTFLNLLSGSVEADSGKINVGDTIVYGYYKQEGLKLKSDKRVIEVIKDIADVIQLSDGSKVSASGFLQHFMFTPEMQHTFVSKLSGGERRRLHLMTVLMKNPNFLILDEPTNDLDLLTLQKLEEFLEYYTGCLMVVSHDRYFLDKTVDHLFIFKGNGEIKDHWGEYSDYKRELLQEQKNEREQTRQPEEPAKAVEKSPPVTTKKLSYKHQYELEQIEKELPLLEEKKKQLETELMEEGLSFESLSKLSENLAIVGGKIDELMLRWMELEEMKG